MEGGLLSDLREVQCLICCLLHQMFIADPNIAKLVHFQVKKQKKENVDMKPLSANRSMLLMTLLLFYGDGGHHYPCGHQDG